VFEIAFQVDYLDTDAMGIVHHSRYCRYLERARVRWLDQIGVNYATLEREGYALPLTGLALEYLRPLRFDDQALVRVRVDEVGKARMKLAYEIWDSENTVLLTRASTEHVLLRNEKPVRIPENWRVKWQQQKEQKSSMSP
jgi:acyl-CoA thioester hydrolase